MLRYNRSYVTFNHYATGVQFIDAEAGQYDTSNLYNMKQSHKIITLNISFTDMRKFGKPEMLYHFSPLRKEKVMS